MKHQERVVETGDGIIWHVELFEPSETDAYGESIVLIPSGEGDCGNLTGLASILSRDYGYSVITFDNPGFSRTKAHFEQYNRVTPKLMAEQIDRLLEELQIQSTNVFGCSSGGLATLALIALYPGRVKRGIVHEVPFELPPLFAAWKELSDEELVKTCQGFFANGFIENKQKWDDLGYEYHARLAKNYITWVRHVVGCEDDGRRLATPGNINKRPVFWTAGSLSEGAEQEQGLWGLDFEVARAAGLKVDKSTLKCLHFPAVSIPEDTAAWIHKCVSQSSGGVSSTA